MYPTFITSLCVLLSLSVFFQPSSSRPLIIGSNVFGDAAQPLTDELVTPSHITTPMTVSLAFHRTSRDADNQLIDESTYVELPVIQHALISSSDSQESTSMAPLKPQYSGRLTGDRYMPKHPKTARILSIVYAPKSFSAYSVPKEIADKITCYAYPKLTDGEKALRRLRRWEQGVGWRLSDGEISFEDAWGLGSKWFLQGRDIIGLECRDW